MSDTRAYRESSAAALSDMQSSNSSLREKFGKLCRQTDSFGTEYQERYQPIRCTGQPQKGVKKASTQVHPSKKASQKKTRNKIDAELVPPKTDEADKENIQSTDNFPDTLSTSTYVSNMTRLDPDGGSFSTSNLSCDLDHKLNSFKSELSDEPPSDSVQENITATKVGKQRRISESTAKYVKWPLPEHIVQTAPTDHEMITNPNTTSFPTDWQSVAHAEMQHTAEQMSRSDGSHHTGRGEISPDAISRRAQSSNTPRFFAWRGAAGEEEEEEEQRKKKVLTFDNVHSEYRDMYVKKSSSQRTNQDAPPKDHQILQFATTAGVTESDWQSTAQSDMALAEHARILRVNRGDGAKGNDVAGLSSDVIAEHLTGRKAPPSAPVFFAWNGSPSLHTQSQTELDEAEARSLRARENVHTESSDSYVRYATNELTMTKRVPPPMDHNVLENVTDHPTPVVYESVTHSQMLTAKKALDSVEVTEGHASAGAGNVSGSTSALLKKDYRKSFAPGYFAWPVPQQFAETSSESHENVHTEYRDNYHENLTSGADRISAPADHNVLGYADDIDATVWKSAAKSQMSEGEGCGVDVGMGVAGASSAFLAKDENNLCPPGFFAWPVVPQTAQRSQKSKKNGKVISSEYTDNFQGTPQALTVQSPPDDHAVIVESLDADHSSEWQSVAQSQMEEAVHEAARQKIAGDDMCLSLDIANRAYRHSFAPDYFAWPVKEQRAERSSAASANVHTEYKDSFIHDAATAAVRAAAPVDHIHLGTSPEHADPSTWKSIATLQQEHTKGEEHSNGQDIVFKNQAQSSTPSFFVWPKDKPAENKSTRSCGYGDKICSEYDSKFVEIDVQNLRVSPIKQTQTIPVCDVDSSMWKSTTKSDMEDSLRVANVTQDVTLLARHGCDSDQSICEKPMNFAWKPLPSRRAAAPEPSRNGPPKTTEHRTSFIDWTPAVHEVREHHLAEHESNINTVAPKKRCGARFKGMSETQSKFQAWSPVQTKKRDPISRAPSLSGSITSVRKSDTAAPDDIRSRSTRSSVRSLDDTPQEVAQPTSSSSVDISRNTPNSNSAKFSTDSLGRSDSLSTSTATSSTASSRQWHTSDDINARLHTTRLGLREDISNTTSARYRSRAMSAPTRRRPHNTHQYTDKVNPILRNSRYPGAIQQQSSRWSTETGTKYTWKQQY